MATTSRSTLSKSSLTTARRDVERTSAAIAELEQRLADAEGSELDAERRRRYEAARKARDAAVKRLADEYDAASRTIVELIAFAAEAEAQISQANEDLPEGAEALEMP